MTIEELQNALTEITKTTDKSATVYVQTYDADGALTIEPIENIKRANHLPPLSPRALITIRYQL